MRPSFAPTVVLVLREGGEFVPLHAHALAHNIVRWWPHTLCPLNMVVLCDDAQSMAVTAEDDVGVRLRQLSPRTTIKGWWAKLDLFRQQHDDLGDILYFDLDTVIVGPLTDVIRTRRLTVLRDFLRPREAQSGMMFLPVEARIAARRFLMRNAGTIDWCSVAAWAATRYPQGDGQLIDALWRDVADRWQDVVPDQVISYKVHVARRRDGRIPDTARVVCFHGMPRPWTLPWWPLC